MSGRPVLVLEGALPSYRDLGPGTVGADVQLLEDGLVRLGFDPGPADGRYDDQTQLAVASWYESAGFAPFGPTDEQLQALRTAQADQSGAQTDLLTARESLSTARGTLTLAQQQAQAARSAMDGAPAAEAAAQATAAQERTAAQADVAAKANDLATANDGAGRGPEGPGRCPSRAPAADARRAGGPGSRGP